MSDAYAVVMAGGSGTRFWPLSRAARPKQLTPILGDATMLAATVARLQPLFPPERILVVTTEALAAATRRELPMLAAAQVIAEPEGRDTAACVALVALTLARRDPAARLAMLPADHAVSPVDAFQRVLAAALALAGEGRLVTVGIRPTHPATGYGYLQLADELPARGGVRAWRVARFVEKPDRARAEQYLADGSYRWNAGIFAWRADTVLAALERHAPQLVTALRPAVAADDPAALARAYAGLPRLSIDYALMERAEGIVAVDGAFAWDDVGSWDALYDHLPADGRGCRTRGAALAVESRDCLLLGAPDAPLIAAVRCAGLSIVATRDAVLVVPRGEAQAVKSAVEALARAGRADLL